MLTTSDIALRAGITIRAVQKRAEALEPYFIKYEKVGRGRPQRVYSNEALSLFMTNAIQKEGEKVRKVRADKGKGRYKISNEEYLKNRIKEVYLSNALNDKQAACRQVCKEVFNEDYAKQFGTAKKMAKYYYSKRLMRNDYPLNMRSESDNNKWRTGFVGYAISERWTEQWERIWKRKDTALTTLPTNRYNYFRLFEELQLAGEGYGVGQFIIFDDHTSDSFMYKDQPGYQGQLPKGLYAIDLLTGMPIDFEPGEVTTTVAGIMVLRIALRYGLPKLMVMENSKAMKSSRMSGIIEALYPEEILEEYKDTSKNYWLRQIWGDIQSPIARNIPLIPRHPGKARIERWFKGNILRHDAKYFPKTYQGGGKNPVQLHLNTNPIKPPKDYTLENYYSSIKNYLEEEIPESMHPAMFPGFQAKTGLEPTIRNAWDYYGGDENAGTGIMPDKSNIANLLYWLAEDKEDATLHKTIVKAVSGRVQCTINGSLCWFVDESLIPLKGQRIAIITVPDAISAEMGENVNAKRNNNFAALFLLQNKKPIFLNICKNIYIDSPEIIAESKAIVIQTRAAYRETTGGENMLRNRTLKEKSDRVSGIGDRVSGIGDRVSGIGNRVSRKLLEDNKNETKDIEIEEYDNEIKRLISL